MMWSRSRRKKGKKRSYILSWISFGPWWDPGQQDLTIQTGTGTRESISASPLGTPVKASSSGVVVYSGDTIKGYGNLIILRHPGEWVSVYAHNQANLVEEGMSVEKGQVIAKVGQTGRATGPHLHFEVRRNNKVRDPLLLLK